MFRSKSSVILQRMNLLCVVLMELHENRTLGPKQSLSYIKDTSMCVDMLVTQTLNYYSREMVSGTSEFINNIIIDCTYYVQSILKICHSCRFTELPQPNRKVLISSYQKVSMRLYVLAISTWMR